MLPLLPNVCCLSPLCCTARHPHQIGPALQEIASLKRSRDALQREVARLQQQLSAAERGAQAAAAAAAAERARAARNGGQGQNKLAAALQRLEAVTAREQQQAATLQEVRLYTTFFIFGCMQGMHGLQIMLLSLRSSSVFGVAYLIVSC